jgi:hypothetical protein
VSIGQPHNGVKKPGAYTVRVSHPGYTAKGAGAVAGLTFLDSFVESTGKVGYRAAQYHDDNAGDQYEDDSAGDGDHRAAAEVLEEIHVLSFQSLMGK